MKSRQYQTLQGNKTRWPTIQWTANYPTFPDYPIAWDMSTDSQHYWHKYQDVILSNWCVYTHTRDRYDSYTLEWIMICCTLSQVKSLFDRSNHYDWGINTLSLVFPVTETFPKPLSDSSSCPGLEACGHRVNALWKTVCKQLRVNTHIISWDNLKLSTSC